VFDAILRIKDHSCDYFSTRALLVVSMGNMSQPTDSKTWISQRYFLSRHRNSLLLDGVHRSKRTAGRTVLLYPYSIS
jgi:hypothetical protein